MPDPRLLEIGRAIRRRRRWMEISQEELAARVGMNASYLGEIERGTKNFGILTLLRVAEALDVEPEELLPGG